MFQLRSNPLTCLGTPTYAMVAMPAVLASFSLICVAWCRCEVTALLWCGHLRRSEGLGVHSMRPVWFCTWPNITSQPMCAVGQYGMRSVSKRWLLSTNPKEMGSLYLLVAALRLPPRSSIFFWRLLTWCPRLAFNLLPASWWCEQRKRRGHASGWADPLQLRYLWHGVGPVL